jgi:two-component system, NtrC family, nitrogen regulation response regulator NtrX
MKGTTPSQTKPSRQTLMSSEILIVDDEADIRLLIAGILEDEGYSTRLAGSSAEAIKAIETGPPPGLIILDIWLQGSDLDGMQLLEAFCRQYPDIPVLMISGHGTIETAVSAIKMGAYDFIEKPFKSDRLLVLVQRALEAALLKRENAELRLRAGPVNELVGESASIVSLRAAVERVAPTGSRILITGPSGSGKEVVARLIHQRSRRHDGPFIVVNAAILTPESLERELFGVEGGDAQAGAARKIGLFEQAHGGTLFIDGVADMPLETQGKIVRVLQDQTFERVGGAIKVEVDVRVIASSTRDLESDIAEGKFREDLFYRLNVVPIRVPPLTSRREDIPALASHFMTHAAASAGLPPRELTDDAIAALQASEWPGNVRQVRNVVEWLLIMATGDATTAITAEHLPPEVVGGGSGFSSLERNGQVMSLPLRDARDVFEREYLSAQIDRFGGNISRTAQFVGMERTALHRKLKSLGVGEENRRRDSTDTSNSLS